MESREPAAMSPVYGYPWDVPSDLSDRRNQQRLSPDALRAFFKLADLWNLKDADERILLGGISLSSLYNLKRDPSKAVLNQDQLTRTSLLIGVFKALNIVFDEKLADSWVTLPNRNPVFGGATPLEYMVRHGVPGIQMVRQLLDARRGGR